MNSLLLGYSIFTTTSFWFLINFAVDQSGGLPIFPEPLIPLLAILPFTLYIKELSVKLKAALLIIVTILTTIVFMLIIEFGEYMFDYGIYEDTYLSFLTISLATCIAWFVGLHYIRKIKPNSPNKPLNQDGP